jgi:hypothetical protein
VLLYGKHKTFEQGINQLAVVSFEIRMAVTMKIIVFWDGMPCNVVEVYQHFVV